jgi:hypothetical protein
VVEDDQVEVLGVQLAAGAGQVVAGLGGSTRTRRAPAGGSTVVAAATAVTSAPRARASATIAAPIRPEERFPR